MSDLIPSSDRELVDLLQNLGVRLAAVVATFNLTAADATAVTSDATSLPATAGRDQPVVQKPGVRSGHHPSAPRSLRLPAFGR